MNSIQGKSKRPKASQNKTANKKQTPSKASKAKKTIGRSILESLGGAAGGIVGLKDLGRDAGAWLSKVTGLGDYKVNSNSFMRSSDDVPVFEFSKDGSVIITHRESLGDLTGSTGTTINSRYYDIHPLNPALFPWLSIEALGYEQYEFLGLLACYNSTCGEAISSTNNSLGTVVFTTEYDVSRPPFYTKQDMESYMFTTAKKPNVSFVHPIECNPKQDIVNARYNNGYFRTQASSTVTTPTSFSSNVAENLQCLGRLQISTVGMQAAVPIGEIWVTYRIKLSKVRSPPAGLTGGVFHASSNQVGTLTSGSTAFGINPSVMADSTYQADTIGITSNTVTLSGLRPQTGLIVTYQARATAGTTPTIGVGTLVLSGLSFVVAGFNPDDSNAGFGTSSYTSVNYMVVGGDPYNIPPTITFPNPTITGAGATFKWDLRVTIVPWIPFDARVPLLTTYEKSLELDNLINRVRDLTRKESYQIVHEEPEEKEKV